MSRSWQFEQAVALDDEGLLAGEIHDAINRVLDLLEEPLILLATEAEQHEPPPEIAGAAARRG